ncbi:MAG: helix-turn-helix domain-containing protein [Pseudomonadota bacterium]
MDFPLDIEDIAFVRTLIEGCGVSVDRVLGELDLPSDLFDIERRHAVTFADYVRILRVLSEISGDETCSGSARQVLLGTTPFLLGGVPENSRLAEVFERIASGYNFAHGGNFNRVRRSSNRLCYIVDDREFPYSQEAFRRNSHAFIESILVSLHNLFEELVGGSLHGKVLKVTTRRSADSIGGSFLRFWNTQIQFDAPAYGIEYDGRISDWPVKLIDGTAFASIFDAVSVRSNQSSQATLEDQSWKNRIKNAVLMGSDDQRVVANLLGVSPATMRRRLANEGTSFRSVRADALNLRAQRLLLRGETPERVGSMLGFSDLRSFARAFKSWNDLTPAAFQKHAGR